MKNINKHLAWDNKLRKGEVNRASYNKKEHTWFLFKKICVCFFILYIIQKKF
ncbi:MAG: hypothetical protein K0R09_3634 [Clostridiales bacterium]|jgi:hypothetical protein|nr:hypothetical protein [Clostridiales bacterium]